MAGRKLKIDEKRFIVRLLAVYESPSEIVLLVKEKYDLEITKQAAAFYDPTTVAGRELSDELKTLFSETRKEFEDSEVLPLSKKIVRIKKLSKYVETFENTKNFVAAAAIVEQIAKEAGDVFTNRRELTGKGGEPVQFAPVTMDEWRAERERRREQAAKTAEMFQENE